MFRSSDDHHQGAFWFWLKSLVKIWVFKCDYAAAYIRFACCIVCDIWINVLLQASALVGPLYIVNWNARWNGEILWIMFMISNFRRVLNVVCFLLGNSLASEFRRRGITQKKAYNIQNMAKVWNQEYFI
jgi:hypothetical protein